MVATIEDFKKLDIRIGTVKDAESIPGTSLIKLTISIGDRDVQTVAALGKGYSAASLKWRQVVFVVLEPKVIKGVRSEGMILAAMEKDRPVLLTVESEVKPGARVV